MGLVEGRNDRIDGQRCRIIRRIGDLRHDEAAQILGIIRIIVAAGDLAGDAVGDRASSFSLSLASKPKKALPKLLIPISVE